MHYILYSKDCGNLDIFELSYDFLSIFVSIYKTNTSTDDDCSLQKY